ncbi:MAG: putative hydrolase [Bacillota bacterium]|nr:putative hydrolase [Bacillota bacterium]
MIQNHPTDTAVVIFHEIYGINEHISGVCDHYRNLGYDVYCPNLLDWAEAFPYYRQQKAYEHFKANIGFDIFENYVQLLSTLRPKYRSIVLIGYSVGATIAWRCSASGLCNGMVGYYGSRIRDYSEVEPKCPALLIFAENEPSFDPHDLELTLGQKKNISIVTLSGNHGFCDRYTTNYNASSAAKAGLLTDEFLAGIIVGS